MSSLNELHRLLDDTQITFFELDAMGETLRLGLIDCVGTESQVTAEGLYQLSISRVPGDKPSFSIFECTLEELSSTQIEKLIPGYTMTYVPWPTETQRGIHVRLEGEIAVEFTCVSLRVG